MIWSGKFLGLDSLSINQGVGVVMFDNFGVGSVSVNPAISTTYRLTATNDGGSVSLDTEITILAEPIVLPSFDTYSIIPNPIEVGQSAIVSWTTSNANFVRFNHLPGETFPANGSITVSPTVNTSYFIIAEGDDGSYDENDHLDRQRRLAHTLLPGWRSVATIPERAGWLGLRPQRRRK